MKWCSKVSQQASVLQVTEEEEDGDDGDDNDDDDDLSLATPT